MSLKPLLFLAGAAAAAAAVIKRRGGGDQLSQAAGAAASRVSDATPQPVKDAAQQAGATVARAVENAPEPIQKAVDKVAPGDGGDQPGERYEPPAEGLAQEPSEPGGPPSDDVPVTQSTRISSIPGERLNTPDHEAPEGSVMPDTSSGDPLVDSQTKAAAGDAGSIGGNVDQMAADDESFPQDPAVRPVVEGAGDESEEAFEEREGLERGHRETES
jgi:hypothetical protein